MALLALKAAHWGAERIPDKAFHAIPGGYFRPPEVDERKRRKREKHRREKEEHRKLKDKVENDVKEEQNWSSSESQSSNEEGTVGSKPRRRERPRRSRNSSYIDRGYESDRGPQVDGFLLPPPRKPEAVANIYPELKPYNPADYAGPPTQEERDRASRASRTQFYGSATYPEYPSNTVATAKESHVGPENLPRRANDAYQPSPSGPVFPHIRQQQMNSGSSPSVDPKFPSASPKARKVSTSPSSDLGSSNSDTGPRERTQSTAEAKYTPINYTSDFYAPSRQLPISDRLERQRPPKSYKPPSPIEKPQPYAPASAVEQSRVASGAFVPQPAGPGAVVPQLNSMQQPASPAYDPVIVPYPTSADPKYPPYDRHASPRNFSPLSNNVGYYSPPRSSQLPHPSGSKDGDCDRDRADNRSRDHSRRSSRLREVLKEHKGGGIGANFAERMLEEERQSKHRKHRDDRLYERQHHKDGYDSY